MSDQHHSTKKAAVTPSRAERLSSIQPNDYGKLYQRSKITPPIKMTALIFTFCIVSLGACYMYEAWRNDQVLQWKADAESAAFKENWDEAIHLLEKASDSRPEYEALKDGLAAVKDAKILDQRIEILNERVKTGDFDYAQKELETIIYEIEDGGNELLFLLKKDLMDTRERLVVATVRRDLETSLSIQSLAGKLLQLSGLQGNEALLAREEVCNKIAAVAIDEAESKVKNAQFTSALNVIDHALGFAVNHKDLESFRVDVETARLDYQNAEYDRLEEAMKQAEEEDLYNRTEAVNILKWEVRPEEDGYIYLTGEVENQATRPISAVEITWGIYDREGTLLDESICHIEPAYLAPGERGEFSGSIQQSSAEGKVEITNITWYLE
ncbi:FxLYD domain-containing protein [Jeotgalibacillus soli]|nr:FxLYD domain-containing protein [Jeotgalibacillus soli]